MFGLELLQEILVLVGIFCLFVSFCNLCVFLYHEFADYMQYRSAKKFIKVIKNLIDTDVVIDGVFMSYDYIPYSRTYLVTIQADTIKIQVSIHAKNKTGVFSVSGYSQANIPEFEKFITRYIKKVSPYDVSRLEVLTDYEYLYSQFYNKLK